ncbi:ASCH domain-containing protein [Providencia rettgeri]|uniref:ASCH domain-containing protein n=1 Tax=Providencia rettgeri TaxID=587 RepID=A0A8E3YMZ0_PRORE|nr:MULTISPECIES: ASCH domain-containing protein [Providencia]HCI95545.1 ASCH domain-containing protein [Providencia sp.]EIU7557992.1 ASCH domain-containing protein [Providencia rettgeri]EJD6081846.1 ASCH domain-containing protein [Providencia rettgeri]EJD6598550.1 ASCH domain-containing protein [Providencia rettgeri]EJD6612941.1 ASCH domain-containing protein [Providencia rettgeri]
MNTLDKLKTKYPNASVWSFGDSPELADELVALVVNGRKTASCSSLKSYLSEDLIKIGGINIILNGAKEPKCVIRTTALKLIKFNEVTEEFARKEGEGDLSLDFWRAGHKGFFTREGCFSDDMELVAEEFELIEVI